VPNCFKTKGLKTLDDVQGAREGKKGNSRMKVTGNVHRLRAKKGAKREEMACRWKKIRNGQGGPHWGFTKG